MAVQAQARPIARWETSKASPSGILGQITSVFISPKAFFQQMPLSRQWVFIAMLILVIAGFGAASQGVQRQSSTAAGSSTQATPANTGTNTGAAQSGVTNTSNQTARSGTSQAPAATGGSSSAGTSTTTSAQQAVSLDANSTLMAALLAASGMLVMWMGQAVLLSLVTMFQGYAPDLGRSVQIAVWASLPLGVMLILRQINFAAGGTGGAVGLSLLLTEWNGFAKLGELAQRILMVFMSNLSLFWLWNVVLLYVGARYALDGNRLSVAVVIVMWIVSAAVVPAFVGNPSTTTGRRLGIVATPQRTTTSPSGNANNNSNNGAQGQFGGAGGAGAASGFPPAGAGIPSGFPNGGTGGGTGGNRAGTGSGNNSSSGSNAGR